MHAFVTRLVYRIGALRADRRGGVLMLFGFALIPLTFATGMGIDYGAAMRLRTKLDAAADAGALAATTTPMLSKTMSQACTAAINMFVQQSGNLKGLTLNTASASGLTITMTETYSGSGSQPVTATCGSIPAAVVSAALTPVSRIATVAYRGTSANSFSNILGIPSLTVKGTSTARVGIAAYYQIVFVVDVSNSMAIGGTASDITKLANDKTITCAFACHDPNATMGVAASDWCDKSPSDYFCHVNGPQYCPFGAGKCATVNPSKTYSDRRGLAQLYGYKLKIDYVNDAIGSFMTSLQPQMQKAPNNYSLSIYTFGSAFTQLQAPTSDFATAKAASDKIDVEVAKIMRSPITNDGNQGWTFTTNGLKSTLASLTNVGDGSSATARKTYVVFLSDGVEDDYGNMMYGRGTYYNYTAQCEAIKNAGVQIFSIETSYPVVSPDTDGQYTKLVAELPSRNNGKTIADVMKGCASSPDKYFMASDGPSIQNSVSAVFAAITAETSRLTR